MPMLGRNGIKIHYEIYGSGPAVLLTHGFGATSEMWAGQIDVLSRHHTLILWDMRGHGRSDSPADPSAYSEGSAVADMAAILDSAGAARAVVGGLSLGGYLSLAFHLAHPHRVRALLLIDTGPGFRNATARAAWNRTAVATAERLEREGLAALASQSSERAGATHRSANGLAHAARGMLVQRDASVIESLTQIAVPTLIAVGAGDTQFLNAADYMAEKIPHASKTAIADAGHAANIDQPAQFNHAVIEFLRPLEA